MNNRIAISLLVAVFTVVALLSTANSVIDSAATALSTYSDEEIEQYQRIIKEGEEPIMDCVLIIACLIIGFLLGRAGSNVCDGMLVLRNRPGDHYIDLDLAYEALPGCRYITLRVVKEGEKENRYDQ